MPIYPITPRGAVRLTRQDTFSPSKAANAYFRYCADIRALGVTIPEHPFIVFSLPMPVSWRQKKRAAMLGQPHKQKPDIDNLIKAIPDALYYGQDDSHICKVYAEKYWAVEGSIEILALPENVSELLRTLGK